MPSSLLTLFCHYCRHFCRIFSQCPRHCCIILSLLSVTFAEFSLSALVIAALFRHYCRHFCRIFSQCPRHCCIVSSLLSSLLPNFLSVPSSLLHCFVIIVVTFAEFSLSVLVIAALFRHYCRHYCHISSLSSVLPHILIVVIVAAFPHYISFVSDATVVTD